MNTAVETITTDSFVLNNALGNVAINSNSQIAITCTDES